MEGCMRLIEPVAPPAVSRSAVGFKQGTGTVKSKSSILDQRLRRKVRVQGPEVWGRSTGCGV